MNKADLIAACIQQIEQQAVVTKKMMDEAQQQSNDYGQPKDRYDSFRTKILRQRDMYARQYQVLVDQTIMLQKIPADLVNTTVQFGSIIKTDRSWLFISVAIGKLPFEGQSIFVLSPSAPIYTAMEGKKVGDTFSINGITQKILEIY